MYRSVSHRPVSFRCFKATKTCPSRLLEALPYLFRVSPVTFSCRPIAPPSASKFLLMSYSLYPRPGIAPFSFSFSTRNAQLSHASCICIFVTRLQAGSRSVADFMISEFPWHEFESGRKATMTRDTKKRNATRLRVIRREVRLHPTILTRLNRCE